MPDSIDDLLSEITRKIWNREEKEQMVKMLRDSEAAILITDKGVQNCGELIDRSMAIHSFLDDYDIEPSLVLAINLSIAEVKLKRTKKTTIKENKMVTRVVNLKEEPYDVYIGRANRWLKLPQSPYANPYKIGKDGDREEVIEKYREWILSQPELVEQAKRELKGKVLGCYCKPESCHGDVLAEIVDSDSE